MKGKLYFKTILQTSSLHRFHMLTVYLFTGLFTRLYCVLTGWNWPIEAALVGIQIHNEPVDREQKLDRGAAFAPASAGQHQRVSQVESTNKHEHRPVCSVELIPRHPVLQSISPAASSTIPPLLRELLSLLQSISPEELSEELRLFRNTFHLY